MQTLLKGVFFFFSFFIQNLGLVCVGRHTGSCMGSNFKCRGGRESGGGRMGIMGRGAYVLVIAFGHGSQNSKKIRNSITILSFIP